MPLTLPDSPARSPSLSNPSTFEADNSAMLAWFKSLVDTMQDKSVLVAGDFGIGASPGTRIRVSDDLNNPRSSGIYYGFTGAANRFLDYNGPFFEFCPFDAENRSQFAIKQFSSPEMGFRTKHGGVWSNWRNLYHSHNILGAVSQSGGIPTGAVIERGSGPNGEYVRFADSTQICTHVLTFADLTTAAGAIYCSESKTWVFPASFAAVPACSGQPSTNADLATLGLGSSVASATQASFAAQRGAARVGSFTARVIAVGRWY